MRLTRHRVEARLPLTMDEIVARQDQVRAQYAVEVRKVEIDRDLARRKRDDLQVALVEAQRAVEAAAGERSRQEARVQQAEARIAELSKEIQGRDELMRQYAGQVREAEKVLAQRNDEMQRLGGLYEESSLRVTSKDVEIVHKVNEIGRLRQQVAKLTKDNAAAREKYERDRDDLKTVSAALDAERARGRELEQRLAIAMREVGDKQAKLARKDNEIDRLKQAARPRAQGERAAPAAGLAESGGAEGRSAIVEELEHRLKAAVTESAEKQSRLARLEDEVHRLRAQMTAQGDDDLRVVDLQKDNLRLAAEVEALREDMRHARASMSGNADQQLRETMHDLAAEVVAMAAGVDGESIERALDLPAPDRKDAPPPNIVSLAERIRKRRANP